jgi:hypothetical protein
MILAYGKYSSEYRGKDLRYLKRSVLKHLLKIKERNQQELWWNEGEEKWLEAFKIAIGNQSFYQLITQNYSQLSSRNIKNILFYKIRGLI